VSTNLQVLEELLRLARYASCAQQNIRLYLIEQRASVEYFFNFQIFVLHPASKSGAIFLSFHLYNLSVK